MTTLPLRICLHVFELGLVVACLAYWWLDNLSHEIFGTALFALLIGHVAFNRRWFGAMTRGRYGLTRSLNTATIVCLGVAMAIMLATSVLISRDIFAFASLDDAFGVREVHMFAAYWVVLIVAVHLGLRWPVVMMVARRTCGITGPSPLRTVTLRTLVLLLAMFGIRSCVEMAFGSKLALTYTLDMWDFNESTSLFFVNYATIVALAASLAYYATVIFDRLHRGWRRAASARPEETKT